TSPSFPSGGGHSCQHGQKCEAKEVSWSRTHKQLEAWLRPRPRITGSSAEKLARMGGTSACWVQDITESTEGGAMHHLREGFSFFLANSDNRGKARRSRTAGGPPRVSPGRGHGRIPVHARPGAAPGRPALSAPLSRPGE